MQTTTTTRSNPISLSLPPELFAEIFPFHLVFNQNQEILQVGEVLQQIYPELALGKQLQQHFRIVRPSIQFDFDPIQSAIALLVHAGIAKQWYEAQGTDGLCQTPRSDVFSVFSLGN